MNSRRELDELIAEKVMEWKPTEKDFLRGHVPDYSTSIEAAWQVVEKIKNDLDPRKRIWTPQIYSTLKIWRCEFTLADDRASDDITFYSGEAETAPHAICLAALKACEVEHKLI